MKMDIKTTIVKKLAMRLIKQTALILAGTALLATSVPTVFAQTSSEQTSSVVTSQTGVPTTRILAVGTLTSKANSAAVAKVLPSEVRQTVQLYLAGKLDQWFVKQDQTGVVFILNVTNIAEAQAMLEKLPLGQAGLMQFQLTPLGPLRPLNVLLAPHS
jgi:hypothetical protein